MIGWTWKEGQEDWGMKSRDNESKHVHVSVRVNRGLGSKQARAQGKRGGWTEACPSRRKIRKERKEAGPTRHRIVYLLCCSFRQPHVLMGGSVRGRYVVFFVRGAPLHDLRAPPCGLLPPPSPPRIDPDRARLIYGPTCFSAKSNNNRSIRSGLNLHRSCMGRGFGRAAVFKRRS